MIYVDTNIILDVIQRDPIWFDWSVTALADQRLNGRLVAGSVVAAEVAYWVESVDQLQSVLDALAISLVDSGLPAAFRAGQAYREYRQRGGPRTSLLPDFLIGAHAVMLGATILTRDPHRFRSYFPDLSLLTPETDHG